MQNYIVKKYSETISDFYFIPTWFFIIWNSKYISAMQNQHTQAYKNKLTNKIKSKFIYNQNANNGSNETTTYKSYLVKTTNTVSIIYIFF